METANLMVFVSVSYTMNESKDCLHLWSTKEYRPCPCSSRRKADSCMSSRKMQYRRSTPRRHTSGCQPKHLPQNFHVSTRPLTSTNCSTLTSEKIDNVLLSSSFLAFVKPSGILPWIAVPDLQVATSMVTIKIEVVSGVLWLCFVQPEHFDSQIVITLLHLGPYICSTLGIGTVKVADVPNSLLHHHTWPTGLNQQTFLEHFTIAVRLGLDCWPDGDHELDIHIFEFLYHRRRVWPESA